MNVLVWLDDNGFLERLGERWAITKNGEELLKQKHMGLLDAVLSKPTGRRPNLYQFNGKQLTIREIAKEIGVSETSLRRKLRRGIPLDQAIADKRCGSSAKLFLTVNGTTKSIRDWAKETNQPYLRLYQRKFENGWPDADCVYGRITKPTINLPPRVGA